nr:pyridoxal 5'-phosphate synthase glutaminase subunit PdxT [Paeniglutamicibacter cryotolerans]
MPGRKRSSVNRIGVLALQGDVREHVQMLRRLGADPVPVRRPEELDGLEGLVLPGGESTVIDKLARTYGVAPVLKQRIAEGLPVYGSCAGMILLADTIADASTDSAGNPQQSFGGIDMVVRRNAFGRQVDSFESDIDFEGFTDPVRAVFIRAPWVETAGAGVRVLARVPDPEGQMRPGVDSVGRIVAVRSGNLLATSFHPEVNGESRIHELFIKMIRGDA